MSEQKQLTVKELRAKALRMGIDPLLIDASGGDWHQLQDLINIVLNKKEQGEKDEFKRVLGPTTKPKSKAQLFLEKYRNTKLRETYQKQSTLRRAKKQRDNIRKEMSRLADIERAKAQANITPEEAKDPELARLLDELQKGHDEIHAADRANTANIAAITAKTTVDEEQTDIRSKAAKTKAAALAKKISKAKAVAKKKLEDKQAAEGKAKIIALAKAAEAKKAKEDAAEAAFDAKVAKEKNRKAEKDKATEAARKAAFANVVKEEFKRNEARKAADKERAKASSETKEDKALEQAKRDLAAKNVIADKVAKTTAANRILDNKAAAAASVNAPAAITGPTSLEDNLPVSTTDLINPNMLDKFEPEVKQKPIAFTPETKEEKINDYNITNSYENLRWVAPEMVKDRQEHDNTASIEFEVPMEYQTGQFINPFEQVNSPVEHYKIEQYMPIFQAVFQPGESVTKPVDPRYMEFQYYDNVIAPNGNPMKTVIIN